MKQTIIQQGAEAIIYKIENKIVKDRISKSYRYPELDNKIRKSRTKSESKIINKLQTIISVPKLLKTDEKNFKIFLEYLPGKKLSDHLENLDYKKIAKKIAENITKIHNQDIIHGDLTTSNMIFKDNKVYFIDFGLGFHSKKIEDKAVDLHLLQQALEAKHFTIYKQVFKIIINNYKANQNELIIPRIKIIEKRGRYKGH